MFRVAFVSEKMKMRERRETRNRLSAVCRLRTPADCRQMFWAHDDDRAVNLSPLCLSGRQGVSGRFISAAGDMLQCCCSSHCPAVVRVWKHGLLLYTWYRSGSSAHTFNLAIARSGTLRVGRLSSTNIEHSGTRVINI